MTERTPKDDCRPPSVIQAAVRRLPPAVLIETRVTQLS
jgi:hypothetical protein